MIVGRAGHQVRRNRSSNEPVPIEKVRSTDRVVPRPVTAIEDIAGNTLKEYPAKCRQVMANSTADAARTIAKAATGHQAALAPRIAAEMYGLEVVASDIADHPDNQTRFVKVSTHGVPAPTGHDRTALVVYQRADEPGSLISILQEFAARRINLSNLFSRPTKAGGLGDYCFILYAEGHVADELLADTMRALHAKQGAVKFLGSYPAAGEAAESARESHDERWSDANDWLTEIRAQIR